MKKLVCIDASIRSSGCSIYDYETERTFLYSYTSKIKKDLRFYIDKFDVFIESQKKADKNEDYFRKYMRISDKIFGRLMEQNIDYTNTAVVFEGYAFAGKGKTFSIGEFGGLLKRHFYNNNMSLTEIPPKQWKMFIANNGNAKKDAIYKTMLNCELKSVLAEFVVNGYTYKEGSWIEDICDVYSIQKYVLAI